MSNKLLKEVYAMKKVKKRFKVNVNIYQNRLYILIYIGNDVKIISTING